MHTPTSKWKIVTIVLAVCLVVACAAVGLVYFLSDGQAAIFRSGAQRLTEPPNISKPSARFLCLPERTPIQGKAFRSQKAGRT